MPMDRASFTTMPATLSPHTTPTPARVSTKAVPKDHSYFHERLDPLGWTPERGRFTTPQWEHAGGVWRPIPEGQFGHRHFTHELFDVDEAGNLLIHYYRITGAPATYRKGDGPVRSYTITRLRVPELRKDGSVAKYLLPKGAGTFPWFPPRLIEAYRESRELDALILTEGALKAFCAANAGADVVGLTSITHVRDRDRSSEQLHQDVVDLIRRCRPRKVIYLVDGDCRHLSSKWDPEGEEDQRNVDLFVRPNQFYSSAKTMRDLLQDLSNELGFSMWFKHVVSGSIELPQGSTPPKGLDDLLLAETALRGQQAKASLEYHIPGWTGMSAEQQVAIAEDRRTKAIEQAQADIVRELAATTGPTHYFFRKSLDRLGEIKKYFALGSAAEFYAEYSERLGERAFVFNGTKYQHDGKELVVILPAVMRAYVRVGDTYYERVPVPNRFGQAEERLHVRQKGTIIDDHGKEMVRRIQKLKAFCNVPAHEDYQPIIANCLNRYQPFEHRPEPGEFPHIDRFLRHIFGTGHIEVPHPKRTDADGRPLTMRVGELDLGYDYLQLLYRQPTQMLPILCLVSKARETGKSTFAKLIKAIFTGNAAFVSSQDLQSDFNEHWITKLVVICEEAFIEKKTTIERIKDLSTASVAMVNAKSVQQVEQEVFIKFILCSNNVRNFINTDNDEIRFWVRNVPTIADGERNPDLEKLMHEEIPALLDHLGRRTMATERLSRMWFDPKLLETDALRLVRESSMPVVRRQLEGWLRVMFQALRCERILMTAEDIKREVFRGQNYEVEYIRRVIKEDLGVQTYRNAKGIKATTSYSYHRWVEKRGTLEGTVQDIEEVKVKMPARPFVFERHLFLDDQTWEMLRPDTTAEPAGAIRLHQPATMDDDSDLPF